MLWQCFYPTVQQAVVVGLSIVCPCILLRLLVLYSGLQRRVLNILAAVLGCVVLWWYYNTSVAYFAVLCGVIYTLLLVVHRQRGAVVSVACVLFILLWYATRSILSFSLETQCYIYIYIYTVSSSLHQKRAGIKLEVRTRCVLRTFGHYKCFMAVGSFLVVAMRNISLSFDLESQRDSKGEYKPARLPEVPDLPAYMSYSLFPGTTVFGPFLTYAEHCKFLRPTPLVSPNIHCRWCVSVYCQCVYIHNSPANYLSGYQFCIHVGVYRMYMNGNMQIICIRRDVNLHEYSTLTQSIEWAVKILSSLLLSAVCLGLSVCIMPFLFNEPHYNK